MDQDMGWSHQCNYRTMRTAHCVRGIACVHCATVYLLCLDCACWAASHQCATGSVSVTMLGAGADGGMITVVEFLAGGTITVTGGTVVTIYGTSFIAGATGPSAVVTTFVDAAKNTAAM